MQKLTVVQGRRKSVGIRVAIMWETKILLRAFLSVQVVHTACIPSEDRSERSQP